jgi:hypothetical protein
MALNHDCYICGKAARDFGRSKDGDGKRSLALLRADYATIRVRKKWEEAPRKHDGEIDYSTASALLCIGGLASTMRSVMHHKL